MECRTGLSDEQDFLGRYAYAWGKGAVSGSKDKRPEYLSVYIHSRFLGREGHRPLTDYTYRLYIRALCPTSPEVGVTRISIRDSSNDDAEEIPRLKVDRQARLP